MSTLVLNKAAISQSLEAVRLLEELRRAYLQHPSTPAPLCARLHDFGEAKVQCPGLVADIPAYTVSMTSQFQTQTSTPPHVIGLFDLTSGALLALLEAQTLLPLTRSLVNALATDLFSDKAADSLVILGASDQARRYVKSLRLVRSLRQVNVYDENLEAAQSLAAEVFGSMSLPATAFRDVNEAVLQQDIWFVSSDAQLPPSRRFSDTAHLTFQNPEGLSTLPRNDAFSIYSDSDMIPGAQSLAHAFQKDFRKAPKPSAFATTLPAFVELVAAWHVYQGAVETGRGKTWEAFE